MCELLLHYLKDIAGHIEYLEERGGVIEEAVAESAVTALTFALSDINVLKISSLLSSARDGVGDVCYLLIDTLTNAQQREALMETFESVTDTALQSEDISRVHVRVVGKEDLQQLVDYYYKARSLIAHPASKLGLSVSALDSVSGFVM